MLPNFSSLTFSKYYKDSIKPFLWSSLYSAVCIKSTYKSESNFDKCRAATNPSPPLFPGPHKIKILL